MKKLKVVSKRVVEFHDHRCGGGSWQQSETVYEGRKHRVPKAKHFTFRWLIGNQMFVEGLMARITLEQQVSVVVKPVTLGKNPAKIDGDVVFTSSDESVATVTSTGQFGAVVKAVGVGAAQITASFDADLDADETRTIVLSGAVEVVDAEAETGVLEFGEPELIPAA